MLQVPDEWQVVVGGLQTKIRSLQLRMPNCRYHPQSQQQSNDKSITGCIAGLAMQPVIMRLSMTSRWPDSVHILLLQVC